MFDCPDSLNYLLLYLIGLFLKFVYVLHGVQELLVPHRLILFNINLTKYLNYNAITTF